MVEVRLVCPRKRCNRARMREGVLPQCPECRGVWIPEAALHERIAHRQQQPPQLAWRREARAVVGCLVCQAPMETLCLYDVPIDRCKGHGIWLDGGELEGVLEHCTRPRRASESPSAERPRALQTSDVAGDVAVGVAEVGIEGALIAGELALDGASVVGHAVAGVATHGVPATAGAFTPGVPVTPGAAAGDLDTPAPTMLGAGAAAQLDGTAELGTGAMDVGGGAEVAGGAADVAGAAAEGAGGALDAVGDVIGTVADGTVTVVGAVATGSVKVVTTIVEGLLDGLGSILDF